MYNACETKHVCPCSRLRHTIKKKKYIQDTSGRLNIHVSYIFIYTKSFIQPISEDRILDQTARLNLDFNANNMDLQKVPRSGNYAFFSDIGNCNITFSVSNYFYTNVEKESFKSLSEIETFMKYRSYQIPIGNLKVYVTKLQEGVLGEAKMFSDCVVVDYRTFGGVNFTGDVSFQNYNTGRTLTHEVGHVLGLPHTFDSNCSVQFEDIPPQKTPNFDAYLYLNTNSQWDGILDNRFRDCNQPLYNLALKDPPYGCNSNCLSDYEMFFNFMDYCNDENSIMFSQKQIEYMRVSLSGNYTKLKAQESDTSTILTLVKLEEKKKKKSYIIIITSVISILMFLFLFFVCAVF